MGNLAGINSNINSEISSSLRGIVDRGFYANGEGNKMSFCRLNKCNKVQTPWGELIPAYDRTDTRAKFRPSICFFESGQIKSIYLQEQTMLTTPIGEVAAELITFYEDGSIHRVFPLYGQISGYWSEEEEYELATFSNLQIGGMPIQGRVSCYCFYPAGSIRSLTFWPKEIVHITTPLGSMEGRLGLSFYENGQVKSFEPQKPILMNTPIGEIMAYDNAPIGIHGDTNSVVFGENGELISLKTIQSIVEITGNEKEGEEQVLLTMRPELQRDEIDPEQWKRHALTISFKTDHIKIDNGVGDKKIFYKDYYKFHTIPKALVIDNHMCTTCENCHKCHSHLA